MKEFTFLYREEIQITVYAPDARTARLAARKGQWASVKLYSPEGLWDEYLVDDEDEDGVDVTYEYCVWVDGGSEGGGEKGPAYGSFYVETPSGDPVTREQGFRLGEATSPEAEYLAFIKMLGTFGGKAEATTLTVFTDSQLLQKQLTRQWAVKAGNLKPLFTEARELMEQFEAVQIEWISGNEMKKILGH